MEPTQFSSISVFINLRKQRLRLIKHLWIIINEGLSGISGKSMGSDIYLAWEREIVQIKGKLIHLYKILRDDF